MANHFVALNKGQQGFKLSDFTVGTSSTSGSDVELRIADGASLTRTDVYNILKGFMRYIIQRGFTNFPAN